MAVWSEVNFSECGALLDYAPDHYHPLKLAAINRLAQLPGLPLSAYFDEVRTIHDPKRHVLTSAARFHDLTAALGGILKEGKNTEEAEFESNKKIAREGDVIVSRLRSYLKEVAVVPATNYDVLLSTEFIVLRCKAEIQKGAFLLPFLLSETVQTILAWSQDGSEHPRFSSAVLFGLRLPNSVLGQAEELSGAVQKAISTYDQSSALYAEAEAILHEALGLDTLNLAHELTYEAQFSDIADAERIDAEHFQPKYAALLAHLQNTHNSVRLGDWVKEPIARGQQPEYTDDGDMMVINSQHVGTTHVMTSDTRRTNSATVKGQRGFIQRNDVLLNSTGYQTIGRSQAYLEDAPAMVDGHVAIIRPKPGLNPIYLALFLNTLPGQMQTERGWTGSSGQIELRQETVANYQIWNAPAEIQAVIAAKVQQAYAARQNAAALLEQAKQRVEALILGG